MDRMLNLKMGSSPGPLVERVLGFSHLTRMNAPLVRHIVSTPSGKSSFPVGSARAWLSDSDVPPERLNLSNARRVVIKVGTAVVSNADGTLALSRLGALVEQVHARPPASSSEKHLC